MSLRDKLAALDEGPRLTADWDQLRLRPAALRDRNCETLTLKGLTLDTAELNRLPHPVARLTAADVVPRQAGRLMASPDDHGHLFAWINALDMMATKALLLADAALARAGGVFALGRVLSLDYSVLASPGFDQLLLLTWKAERRIDALFGPENRPYVTVTGVVSLPRQAPFSLDCEFEVTRDAAT